ncbi:serine/threonine-protein kinase [Microbacterium aurantiacum]|uniref:serine/threonine-protein kinase n=1 Tax=Microbacterium aurantiacum TaxID=162393 RepID=UPI000C80F72B|nr:serine/threonine-protein kinase [Microbacterium aurantiacum]
MPAAPETRTAELLDGRYQLGECIGQGGAARVYRADDVLLGRTVAVKMMQADAEALSAPARVRNEIAVLASLTHPSLVELYDAHVMPGHACYLVMEFIDGPTLAGRLREGSLSPSETTALGRDLASALHTVHAAGVVHRDIKPANVLLAPAVVPGADFRAKLADFGVAFLLDTTRVTNPGTIVGTAAYLPPEQIRGEAATPPGDIYALGLVLLEAITGERAFPQATGVGAVMARLFDSPRIPEWLGPEWSGLLTRMTATEPELRPTALDVATTLTGLPGPTRPASAVPDGVAFSNEPLEATKLLPVQTEATNAPATTPPDRPRATLIKVIGAATVAMLCILGAIWTAEAGAGSATAPRQSGTVFERTVAPAPATDDGTPGEQVSVVPDPEADKQQKAEEKARKDAEDAQRAEEKAREKAEKDKEKEGKGG